MIEFNPKKLVCLSVIGLRPKPYRICIILSFKFYLHMRLLTHINKYLTQLRNDVLSKSTKKKFRTNKYFINMITLNLSILVERETILSYDSLIESLETFLLLIANTNLVINIDLISNHLDIRVAISSFSTLTHIFYFGS